jgi:Uma2 family endonuclease
MIQTLVKPLTLTEFLKLPETKPAYEFINGELIQKPMPQGKHSTLQIDLGSSINLSLKPECIARAYSELRCTFGDRSIIPDISIFTWERIPHDLDGTVSDLFEIAPDWTIEILSPDQNQTKVIRNILHCLNHGTQMGWLIDPDEELIFVYFAGETHTAGNRTITMFETQVGGTDVVESRLPVPSFAEAFHLTANQLFSWLKA